MKNILRKTDFDDAENVEFSEIDYDKIEESVYDGVINALEDYDDSSEVAPQEATRVIVDNFPHYYPVNVNNFEDFDYATLTDAIGSSDSDNAVEFATTTDSTLYTVSTLQPTSSASAQSAVYLLEIRNIVLIFCLFWISIYIVSMLKKVSKRYGKGGKV